MWKIIAKHWDPLWRIGIAVAALAIGTAIYVWGGKDWHGAADWFLGWSILLWWVAVICVAMHTAEPRSPQIEVNHAELYRDPIE